MKIVRLILFVCFITFTFSPAFAQTNQSDTALEDQENLLRDEITREIEDFMRTLTPPKKPFTFRYGGWINSIFRHYTDIDNDHSSKDNVTSMWLNELRLWAMMNVNKNINVYTRIKNMYLVRETSSATYTGIGDDYSGPHLDVGYLKGRFDINAYPLTIVAGRQYNYLGRGITYRQIDDGLKVAYETSDFFYKGFVTHTLPNENNIDNSQPQYDKKGNRLFAGLEMGYLAFPNSVLYGYYLFQNDLSPAHFEGDNQTYRYDSQYLGLGLEGDTHNFDYSAEIIKSFGRSYADTEALDALSYSQDSTVDAWALDIRLRHTFDYPSHPFLEFEYGYGSGDEDRSSVTNSRSGGNTDGTDKNFLYFGTYYAGYALAPRLSNIHIYKTHLSFNPLELLSSPENKKINKKVRCGIKHYFYQKDENDGGISDGDATSPKRNIGQELDFYLYWDILPSCKWSMRYGIFYPGNAFPSNTNSNTKYIYTRMSFIF